ncbi:MAG: BatD family protein [Verrucomicrobiales bacterium]|nr:BatD family protein [Verrucomicrobiales bacterium]
MRYGLSILLAALVASGLIAQEPAKETPVVTSELPNQEVWVGQGSDFIIKLWAPGPFSGTANFNIPRIEGTTIVRQGNPTVSSETVDGTEYFTQRHRFVIYTQKAGSVTIPAFTVQFEAKRSFTGDPEPFEGTTDPLTFEAKRPPGTEELEHVVSARSMSVKQSWSPDSEEHPFSAGDILTRTIERSATGTSAMMLSPFPNDPIKGIRIYQGQPIVEDKTDRGTSSARRVDVIKYQFERGGSFKIPSLTFSWWHPESSSVKTESFAGTELKVEGPRIVVSPKQKRQLQWAVPISFLALIVVTSLAWKPVTQRLRQRREWRNRPEALNRKAFLKACRDNNARAAQAAYLNWKASTLTDPLHGRAYQRWLSEPGNATGLEKATNQLAEHLYAASAPAENWNGDALRVTFLGQRKRWLKERAEKAPDSSLARLNPV